MAIRYTKNLTADINKIVRNYNAKISRLEKIEEELYLPEKTSINEIKEMAHNRRELNRMLKDLQRFSKKGMEKTVSFSSGVEMSRYEAEKLKNNLRIAKAKATRELKNFKSTPIKVFGIPQNTPHEYDEAYLNLKAQREQLDKDISKLSKRELERLESNINDLLNSYDAENLYKNNWLDMFDKLSYYGEIDESKKKQILERLDKLSPSNFTKLYRNEKSIKAMQELYKDVVRNKSNVDDELTNDINEVISNFYNNLDIILKDYE